MLCPPEITVINRVRKRVNGRERYEELTQHFQMLMLHNTIHQFTCEVKAIYKYSTGVFMCTMHEYEAFYEVSIFFAIHRHFASIINHWLQYFHKQQLAKRRKISEFSFGTLTQCIMHSCNCNQCDVVATICVNN